MTTSRRGMLALLGGGAVIAAGAGAGAFVATRTPAQAIAPWGATGAYVDPRLNALSFAILAPNPHNLQPWMAELRGDDTVAIHRDPTRMLPETDPYDRQIVIGFGCFLEQMAIAASVQDLRVEVELFPDSEGEGHPVAVARFSAGGRADPLAAAMLDRRSCKEPFDMTRPVAAGDAAALANATAAPGVRVGETVEANRVAALRGMIIEGWEIEALTPRTLRESVDLIRVGRPEIEANPDGIDLQSPVLEALRRIGFLTQESLLDTEGAGFQSTMRTYRGMFEATPAFIWLATPGNRRRDQVAAGRAWLRLNLAATAAGLALHPVSQVLQEYPEMDGLRARAHEMLGFPGETVQMLGRLGYGPETPPAPRWPLEAKLVDERSA